MLRPVSGIPRTSTHAHSQAHAHAHSHAAHATLTHECSAQHPTLWHFSNSRTPARVIHERTRSCNRRPHTPTRTFTPAHTSLFARITEKNRKEILDKLQKLKQLKGVSTARYSLLCALFILSRSPSLSSLSSHSPLLLLLYCVLCFRRECQAARRSHPGYCKEDGTNDETTGAHKVKIII